MKVLMFISRLEANGSVMVSPEVIETLGLYPGDEIIVRIETVNGVSVAEIPDQMELHRRSTLLFEEADTLVREPGRPLSEPMEVAWAQGAEEKARKRGLEL